MNYKNIVLIFGFFLLSINVHAQQETDGKTLFKMWFFLEHVNEDLRTEKSFQIKDSSLYNLYNRTIDFRFDTLTAVGWPKTYLFLSVVPYKNNLLNNDSAITFKKGTGYLSYLGIPVNNCEGYVLCINKKNGRSYRVSGFYGNDFLSLFTEVKNQYAFDNNLQLLDKIFFKKFKVTGVDFECLYKALTSASMDRNEFPCLRNCQDFHVGGVKELAR